MKNKYLIMLVSFYIMGIGCLITYKSIGAKVLPDGTLVESFTLIPIRYLLISTSLVAGVVMLIRFLLRKKK